MKNILITGEIKTGKSTLVRAIANQLGIPACGFLTLPYFEKGKREGFFLGKLGESPIFNPDNQGQQMFCRYDPKRNFDVNTQVFESFGVQLAEESLRSDKQLVIIDELGFMERDALAFQQEIFRILESGKLVIAVIKPRNTKFLNEIRQKGKLFDLDRQYAEDILRQVCAMRDGENNLYSVGKRYND